MSYMWVGTNTAGIHPSDRKYKAFFLAGATDSLGKWACWRLKQTNLWFIISCVALFAVRNGEDTDVEVGCYFCTYFVRIFHYIQWCVNLRKIEGKLEGALNKHCMTQRRPPIDVCTFRRNQNGESLPNWPRVVSTLETHNRRIDWSTTVEGQNK